MTATFITERPTQIVTALAIIKQKNFGEKIFIIIVDEFAHAKKIKESFSLYYTNINFIFVDNYSNAIAKAKEALPSDLYIHWDVGFRTQKWLKEIKKLNKSKSISVFEEGIGTYSQEIYSKLKKMIFKHLSLPTNIGASKYIEEIFVYDKNKYIQAAERKPKKITEINYKLEEFLTLNINTFIKIFHAEKLIDTIMSQGNRKCVIYLSNWNFKKCDLNIIPKNIGPIILKLHPHCKETFDNKDFINVPAEIPAEILLIIALKKFSKAYVYHKNSSIELYIKSEKVEFRKI